MRGVPFAVKDNIDVAGFMTTCASPLLLQSAVASRSAPAVDAVVAASATIIAAASTPAGRWDAVPHAAPDGGAPHTRGDPQRPVLAVCGKTNMDAFGVGGASTHSAHGAVRHPLDARRTAGGSSGGSAAAVASGAALFALGSDTGGSVRQPAAVCGVVGLRAGRGGVVRDGLVAYSPSMDALGVLAPTVAVARAVYSAMRRARGIDAVRGDGDCASAPAADGPSVALLDSAPPLPAHVRALLRRVSRSVVHAAVPAWPQSLAAYTAIAAVEAASSLARFLVPARRGDAPQHPSVLGPAAGARVLLGRWIARDAPRLFADARAHALRLEEQLARVLARVDAIALPAAAGHGPPPLASDVRLAPQREWIDVLRGACPPSLADDALTVPASLAGLPAMAVPVSPAPQWPSRIESHCGGAGAPVPQSASAAEETQWPLAVQLVCRRGAEDRMLALAAAIERCAGRPARR